MTLSVQGPIDDLLDAIKKISSKDAPKQLVDSKAAKGASSAPVPIWVWCLIAYVALK